MPEGGCVGSQGGTKLQYGGLAVQGLYLLDQAGMEREVVVQAEWQHLLQRFLLAPLMVAAQSGQSPRSAMEACVRESTHGRAQFWWEAPPPDALAGVDRIVEVRWGKRQYGRLGFAPGYLVSTVTPAIPECFAQLCGLLLALDEYQMLMYYQTVQLLSPCIVEPLTPREQDVLMSLAGGESEEVGAQRLGITPKTMRCHRHRLYGRLGVHTSHEAVLRGFVLGLLDLLKLAWPQ